MSQHDQDSIVQEYLSKGARRKVLSDVLSTKIVMWALKALAFVATCHGIREAKLRKSEISGMIQATREGTATEKTGRDVLDNVMGGT